MIRALILDGDGVAILRVNRFSDRLAVDFGIGPEVTRPFFRDKYPACRVGKADLKIELMPHYKSWAGRARSMSSSAIGSRKRKHTMCLC